ncbi:MAG: ADP-glyceromanno-heptose 6-epimerase [Dissulfurispiraceae bacterium]|nr:ADP-glyceromanno-heptose 6-epimerase [Dissulfurispiraceae bacterium]
MIVITGGAGFIGSAVIWELNQRGIDDIMIVDHLGSGEKWENLVSLKFRDYIEKDRFAEIIMNKGCSNIFGQKDNKIETILHLGACSSTTETDASFLITNNFEYTKNLALYALSRDIRFIYASSAATYGDGSNGFSDKEENIDSLRPMNIYGYSKHLFDQWALHNSWLQKIAGLKYFNIYGPNEYHKEDMRSVVLKAYEQIVSTGRIKLFRSHNSNFADGEQLRDFLYVKDAATITIHFVFNKNLNGIFNVGSGEARTWNSIAEAIFKALGKSVDIEYIDMPESIREKYQYYTCADITKLRQSGYKESITSLEKSVEDYIKKYLLKNARLD